MVKPRLFKSSHINKFFSTLLLFTILATNVLYPAVVIAQELDSPVEEESVIVDTSEDILDEGIETNIFEEEIPEPTYLDGIYTVNTVEEKEYVYPDNDNVRVKFTKVTENGNLVIKKVALTEEERAELNTTDEYGWDISSTMTNGSFTYDLTLPNTQGDDVEVMYSEDGEDYVNISNEIVNKYSIQISNLDHFTTYVVTTPPALTGAACIAAGATVGLGCFPDIQSAVTAAASGDTLLIKAGTHTLTSQLVISKDLTIIGEDEATTIIVPGFNTASSGDARGLILLNNNANVNISDITIDGSGQLVYQAIRANNAGIFNMSNATIQHIDHSQYVAFGIALMNTNGTMTNVTMSNIKRVGTIVFGTSNYTFNNYTYAGKGSGDWLDYGIELGGGGNANIQNSHIYDCRGIASVDGSTSGAILATTYYGAGTGANIEYSNFENNSTALLVGYSGADTSIVTAQHNDFANNDLGVSTTATQVDARYSKWGTSKESEILNLIDGDVLYNPWYGKDVTSTLTVNEYQDSGIHYVKDLLDFDLNAEPVYGQHLITGLWGYNEATGSRDNSRYIGWQTTNPNSNDIVNENNAWNMVTDHWMGLNAPGTEIAEGNYLLWTERYYDEGGYVSGSTIKERVTVDRTKPTGQILTPVDGDRTNGTITVSGWVADALSGIEKVMVRLRNYPGNTFRTDWVEATVDGSGNFTVDIDPTALAEDDYEVAVVAYDNAGNNKWLWRRPVIAVDRTAPSAPTGLQIIDHEGTVLGCGGYTNNRNITIDWADNPEMDLANYILDLKDKDNHKQPVDSEYVARIRDIDGLYKYKIRATDIAGNTGLASEWCEVKLDRVAPTGEIKGIKYTNEDVESFITNDDTPILYGTYDDNNGVANVNIELYGQSYMPQFTGGIWISSDFGPIPDGVHTATLTVTDDAGNETVVTQGITVDTSAPRATYTHFDNGSEITDPIAYVKGISQLTFTGTYLDEDPSSELLQDSYVIFEAQDDGSFRFSQNGKKSFCSWRQAPNLLPLSGTTFTQKIPVEFTNCIATVPDGEYYMAHQVYDNATRKDIPSITQFRDVLGLHFVVDTQMPTINQPKITADYMSQYVNGFTGFMLSAKVSDTGSGIDTNSCMYTLDGGNNWSAGQYSSNKERCYFTVSSSQLFDNQSLNMQVKVSDKSGNTQTSTVLNRTVDSALPRSATHIPNDYYGPFSSPEILGKADDTVSGISNVKILLQRSSDNRYWSGYKNLWLRFSIPQSVNGTNNWSYTRSLPRLSNGLSYKVTPLAWDNVHVIPGTGGADSFIWDNQKPEDPDTFTASHQLNTPTSNKTITVNFAGASDALSGVKGYYYSFSNAPETPARDQMYWLDYGANSVTSPELADGEWYFNIRTVDNVGNMTATANFGAMIVDTTAPEVPTLLTPTDNLVTRGDILTSSWSFISDADHYIYESYHNDSATNLRWHDEYNTNSKTAFNVADSTFWWRVKAVDAAGNISEWSNLWKVTIDNTAPETPEVLGFMNPDVECGGYTNIATTTVDWTEPDGTGSDIKQYEYQINYPLNGNRGLWTTTFTQSQNTGSLNEGTHYIRVRAQDMAGNWSDWSTEWSNPAALTEDEMLNTCSITLDTEAPDTTVTSPLNGEYVNGTIDLKGTVIENNLWRYYYKISGTENVASKVVNKDTGFTDMTFYTWDTTMYQDGEYTILLSARDKANNKDGGSTDTITVNVDNTRPEVLAVEDVILNEGDDLPTDVVTTATDNNGVVELCYSAYNVDFGTTTDCVTPTAATNNWEVNVSDLVIDGISAYLGSPITKVYTSLIPEGIYEFTYYVTDIAGNQSDPHDFTLTINNVAPEATLGANTTDILEDADVTFTASFTDPSDIGQTTPDDSDWTYTLNYGDGVTVSGVVANAGSIGTFDHTYTTEGSYTASLEVCEDTITGDGEGLCHTSEVVITVTAPEVLGAQATAVRATGSVVALGTGGGFGTDEQSEEEEEEATTEEDDAEVKGTQSCENPKKLSGYIYVDKNENDEKDADEKIFSDIRVTIYSEDEDGNKTYTKVLTTNSEGYWETYVCNGEYKISVNSEDLPKNYSLDTEDVLGVTISDTIDEANVNIQVSDDRSFLQKNWIWILLAITGVTLTGYLVIAGRKRD